MRGKFSYQLDRKNLIDLLNYHILLVANYTTVLDNLSVEILYIKSIIQDYSNRPIKDILTNHTLLAEEFTKKIIQGYEQLVQRATSLTLEEAVIQWTAKLNLYGYVGGYGHYLHFKNYSSTILKNPGEHSHWVIDPHKFELVKPSIYEKIALDIWGIQWSLDETPAPVKWGN